jgi:hypothetical protein
VGDAFIASFLSGGGDFLRVKIFIAVDGPGVVDGYDGGEEEEDDARFITKRDISHQCRDD